MAYLVLSIILLAVLVGIGFLSFYLYIRAKERWAEYLDTKSEYERRRKVRECQK